jgi:hypothetical protein
LTELRGAGQAAQVVSEQSESGGRKEANPAHSPKQARHKVMPGHASD